MSNTVFNWLYQIVIHIIILIIKFVNLSMSAIGLMGKSSESLLLMLEDLNTDKSAQKYTIRKIMNIAIRCTYYVFCCHNKPWNNPDLLGF